MQTILRILAYVKKEVWISVSMIPADISSVCTDYALPDPWTKGD